MMVGTKTLPGGTSPVQIGALWHSAWELEKALQKYCKPILALTDDSQFPYCLRGSGAAIRMAERHFLFCCRHQISGYAPDKIAIPLSFETKLMSASSMRELTITEANRDGDTIDVAALEYDVENYGIPNLTSEFFPIDDFRVWPYGTAQLPFLVFGYSSKRQLFDEDGISARKIEFQATYNGATSSPHLHRMKAEKAVDADGMSGGPVFYIGRALSGFFVGFAGIVMRGGQNSRYLHFMAANFLFQMALESSTVPWT